MRVFNPCGATLRAIGRIAFLAALVQAVTGMNSAIANQPSETLWSYPAGRIHGVPERLQVTGTKEAGIFRPTGLSLPDAPAAAKAPPFPFDADLLPLFQAAPFGSEERVAVSTAAGHVILTCSAGERPAGVLLKADRFRYPQAMRARLVIEGRGSEAFSFHVVARGEDAPAGLPAASVGGLLASIPASAWATGDAAAMQLVAVCPQEAASATISAIRLVADGHETLATGTWLWDVRAWLDDPQELVSMLRREAIAAIFVQLRIEDGMVADAPRLAALLAALSRAGIAIHAVEGDADMASAEGRPHALERARILRRFKQSTGLIRSFQYDIEPYLRPAFAADPAAGWREWAVSVRALAGALGEKVSVVVPFWMRDGRGGEQALAAAADAISDVVVMAYRTDGAQIERIAGDWLDWGEDNDFPIGIALENGPLSPEYVRTYRKSAKGSLVLDRSGPAPVVRMLGFPVVGSYTNPTYSFTQEMEVDPARISFLNDGAALAEARERIGRILTAWSSFQGLMIHGLMAKGG